MLQICTCRQEQVAQQIHQRLFSISNLDNLQHLTFENFQSRGRIGLGPWQADSLERAFNQAQLFSQRVDGWLLLQGGFGCGKTHLAAAVANFTVGLGVPTLFITVPDLLDALRFTYNNPESTFEQRFDEIRTAPLLIMDDFGTQNATAWAQEKLFQILNYRYINRLPLVVTTHLLLDQIEGRIRSRLEDPELVTRVFIQARLSPTHGRSPIRFILPGTHHEQTSNWDDRQ
jgi:DNA replication protein DnaC